MYGTAQSLAEPYQRENSARTQRKRRGARHRSLASNSGTAPVRMLSEIGSPDWGASGDSSGRRRVISIHYLRLSRGRRFVLACRMQDASRRVGAARVVYSSMEGAKSFGCRRPANIMAVIHKSRCEIVIKFPVEI